MTTEHENDRGDFLAHLRSVNGDRLASWEGELEKTDGIFHAAELGGEVGEVLNIVKKLHREEKGWRGSRASIADLAEEIGDVMICLDKLAAHYGIDIEAATIAKFNATSAKVGLSQRLSARDGGCFLCAEKCCGHSLGYSEEWIPEAGSRGAQLQVEK
jgi:NTP pyrophosphatase (non-canonical NTP hydrolase)